ncbi:MAG: helix-turn-helix domain-containing protein [Nanoarchaeota archaeon]|nr:helix-turn-helix domain-containing protein [Nanoarchaeota archaeon]
MYEKAILSFIRRDEEPYGARIARELRISKGTVYKWLKRLEEEGVLRREKKGRVKVVRLKEPLSKFV